MRAALRFGCQFLWGRGDRQGLCPETPMDIDRKAHWGSGDK